MKLRNRSGATVIMHERSLVLQLIDQVCREAAERGLDEIHEIHLQVGEFSGVESRLVQLAFEELAPLTWTHRVELKVDTVQLTAKCEKCQCQFHVEAFRFICPECRSGDVRVISGEELQLVSLSARRIAESTGEPR
jgi:hydrogenase nickel incorporation protein HypA/HybF